MEKLNRRDFLRMSALTTDGANSWPKFWHNDSHVHARHFVQPGDGLYWGIPEFYPAVVAHPGWTQQCDRIFRRVPLSQRI